MTPPLLGVEGEGQSNASLAPSPPLPSLDSCLKERNYFGFSESSSVDSSTVTTLSSKDNINRNLNLKATELRLGLPGSQSPERDISEPFLLGSGRFYEKPLFPLTPTKDTRTGLLSQKTALSGNKRGFADTADEFVAGKNYNEGNWMFKASGPNTDTQASAGKANHVMPSTNAGVKSLGVKDPQAINDVNPKSMHELPRASTSHSAPSAKAQVVGWPPIRSFRKISLATSSKNNDEVDGKPGASPLFMKVSMDGAPYLRKVDLRLYSTYQELSWALEKMFSGFTGQYGSGAPGRENLSENKLKDLLNGSESVLTYEDKDGDWMLVGDVPWEMFIDSCKRLKIMKSSDDIGLAPRCMEKSKC